MTMRPFWLVSILVLALPAVGCLAIDEEVSDDDLVEQSFNACEAIPLEVIVQGRENRFGLNGQQVALDPGIPMDRICQRVTASCRETCKVAAANARATGIRGFQDADPVRLRQMGRLADDFNAALGMVTRFSELGADSLTGDAVKACGAKQLQVVVRGREHRFGFDGRQVALNPAIPIDNICNSMGGSCRQLCTTAKSAAQASGVTGFSGPFDAARLRQMGVLADKFNATFGSTTNFASAPIFLP
jgi:hypothetical protein